MFYGSRSPFRLVFFFDGCFKFYWNERDFDVNLFPLLRIWIQSFRITGPLKSHGSIFFIRVGKKKKFVPSYFWIGDFLLFLYEKTLSCKKLLYFTFFFFENPSKEIMEVGKFRLFTQFQGSCFSFFVFRMRIPSRPSNEMRLWKWFCLEKLKRFSRKDSAGRLRGKKNSTPPQECAKLKNN